MDQQVVQADGRDVVAQGLQRQRVVADRELQLLEGDVRAGDERARGLQSCDRASLEVVQERSEEQIISRLLELDNEGQAERRAELTDERFLSLLHDQAQRQSRPGLPIP